MTDLSNHIQLVRKLSRSIANAEDSAQIYQLIVDELSNALNVDRVSLMVYDPEKEGLVIKASRGIDPDVAKSVIVRLGEGISGKVFAERKPALLKDIQAEQGGVGKYKTTSLMSAPVTCSPMKMGDEVLGVINVTDKKDSKSFSDDDLNLLMTIADVSASYVRLMKLTEEVKKTEKIKQELEIARNIQYRLLPSRPPKVNNLDVAGRCITAERVGGDYYDYFMKQNPVFAVADVSGHSIGAALIMSAFRAAIRSQLMSLQDISIVVQQLNRILYEDLFQAEQFVSLALVEYYPTRKMISFITAGHPPILVWRSAQKKFETLYTEDPLIGIESMAIYKSAKASLQKGDIVLIYSDGLTEAPDVNGERFGLSNVQKIISKSSDKTSEGIVEDLMKAVMDFCNAGNLRDDVTLMVLKSC